LVAVLLIKSSTKAVIQTKPAALAEKLIF